MYTCPVCASPSITGPPCWRCKGLQPPPLRYPEQVARPMLAAYYRILSSDPRFLPALQQLYEQVRPSLVNDRASTPPIRRAFRAFADDWRLPRRQGVHDLRWSLRLIHADLGANVPTRWQLEPGSRSFGGLRRTTGEERLRTGLDWATDGPPSTTFPIFPKQPSPFLYDPTQTSPAQLHALADRVADEIRTSILEQAAMIEAHLVEQGLSRTAPRHRNPEHLERIATRLYRRVILRWSWDRIAAAEDQDDVLGPDPKTVETTVREWAGRLDIALPKLPSGRPRRKPLT